MNKRDKIIVIFLISIALLIVFIRALPPTWDGSDVNYLVSEDSDYYHDLRQNITGFNDDVVFYIDGETNISWTNITGTYSVAKTQVSKWISILNSSLGNLSINASFDNQTGFFIVPIQATNTTNNDSSVVNFEFMVNATNDAPSFASIENEYNLTQEQSFFESITAGDEEQHYPLGFNITFINNCTHASWSNRGNCTLFGLVGTSNTSASMNLTPSKNDVGIYYANITINDNGENYNCSSGYCSGDYSGNKTTSYSNIIIFNIFSFLEINASDCQNKIYQENETSACYVNITTRGSNDSINVSSLGFLRNYAGSISNSSWFYGVNLTNTNNFTSDILINATPGKTEVGNWTINFSVSDFSFNQNSTQSIYVYVNRTYNDAPELVDIENRNTSIDLAIRINLTVYDDDLLIPDKLDYNESINFTINILNQSNLSQGLSLNGFDVQLLGTTSNRTEAKIEFTPNSSENGNYTINITAKDQDNVSVSDLFNLSIISNNAPVWNESLVTNIIIYEDNLTTLNLSQNITDSDGDNISFSFTNDTSFPGFNLNASTGIINFTPSDADVGQHIVTINASDGYLINSSVFNFTIYNINDNILIETPLSVTNATVDANSNMVFTEDNLTGVLLWIQDDDFKIPLSQKSFYNESLNISVTIQGVNTTLFQIIKNPAFPIEESNRSNHQTVFTPKKTDVGSYNISINVSDLNGSSSLLQFNLTVVSVEHNPNIINITDYVSAVNRNFYYRINASDIENGFSNLTDNNTNFTFKYNFISGSNIFNSTIFNTTTGEINMTFNNIQGGKYNVNITVNDSAGREDSDDFWIYVYDNVSINYPAVSYEFSLAENISSNLTFYANHSVEDNLTYEIYINNSLKYNISYYGNNSNLTWTFTPNFSEELSNKNLTLIAYPLNPGLENRTDLNLTRNWNITINHTNAPVVFSGYIPDSQADYSNVITFNLADYFSDIDYYDLNYNQTINFSVMSNSTPSSVSSSISNWTMTISSSVAVVELLNITASDLNDSNVSLTRDTSNDFTVRFTTPSTTPVSTPSSGGGGSSSGNIPYAFKLIVPGKISAYANEKITIPISLLNQGKNSFKQISLISEAFKDGKTENKIETSFDKSFLPILNAGESQNLSLVVFFNTNKTGEYEILINATSASPKYTDWSKIYISLQKPNETEIERYLLFTEEFIVENPECLELKEILNEAWKYFDEGDYANARLKTEQVVNSCEEFISQSSLPTFKLLKYGLNEYLVLATLFSFFGGISYYYIKRRRLRKALISGNSFEKI